MKTQIAVIASAAVVVTALVAASGAEAHTERARARVVTADGVDVGTVDFRTDEGHTEVRVRLSGVPGVDAFHGFHIHANDITANGDGCLADPAAASSTWFASADGHYNPTGQTHAHHAGDLPVVLVNRDGTVETRFQLDRLVPADLDNKAVVLHAGADTYANVPVGTGSAQYSANSADAIGATAKTGNAGDRVACGVIRGR